MIFMSTTSPSKFSQFFFCNFWISEVDPLQAMKGALGERRYSPYSFLTSAVEGGEWSASRPGRALPPGKEPPVPTVQEAGWVPEPVWTQRLEEKSSASVGDRTPAVQSVVRHCTDWATPALPLIFGCISFVSLYIAALSYALFNASNYIKLALQIMEFFVV
jgi:hypothetical protein